ncbi:unnamed protein product [Prorocentrum cordatum]|uniref:Uncharacterized protein n=1 Tax=Prorocentrum cordatum TaxID=2364126 RepID=A0ABN9U2M4_9DINO|nr:unnamed protein product [Polarella glacialis]
MRGGWLLVCVLARCQPVPASSPLRALSVCSCHMSAPQEDYLGTVLVNGEIPDDRLVRQVRAWAASSRGLSGGDFDLLQVAEAVDGRAAPRAICGVLRAQLLLAGSAEPVRAIVALFYRARDYLNQEFWEDQVRRLCDIVSEEYLRGGRGVQLMSKEKVGLLGELEALHSVGPSWRGAAAAAVEPELLGAAGGAGAAPGGPRLHVLTGLEGGPAGRGSLAQGRYVLRGKEGEATCGVRVLGTATARLLCSSAWAGEGRGAELAALVESLRRRSGRPACTVLADARDARWRRLCSEAAPSLGLWRARRPAKIAITGVPVGLTEEEQVSLAREPFEVPWEFLPFHAGRVVLI